MSKNLEIWRGDPYPLGATPTDEGVNFALYAENAIAVELCLFDSPEPTATEVRIPLNRANRPNLACSTAGDWTRAALRISRTRCI